MKEIRSSRALISSKCKFRHLQTRASIFLCFNIMGSFSQCQFLPSVLMRTSVRLLYRYSALCYAT